MTGSFALLDSVGWSLDRESAKGLVRVPLIPTGELFASNGRGIVSFRTGNRVDEAVVWSRAWRTRLGGLRQPLRCRLAALEFGIVQIGGTDTPTRPKRADGIVHGAQFSPAGCSQWFTAQTTVFTLANRSDAS